MSVLGRRAGLGGDRAMRALGIPGRLKIGARPEERAAFHARQAEYVAAAETVQREQRAAVRAKRAAA